MSLYSEKNFLNETAPLSHLSSFFIHSPIQAGMQQLLVSTQQNTGIQGSIFPLLPLPLRLYFCFQAIDTVFPEDLQGPQQHTPDSMQQTRQLLHTHDCLLCVMSCLLMFIQPAPGMRQELARSHPISAHCNCILNAAQFVQKK